MKDMKEKLRDIEDKTKIYNICLTSSGKKQNKREKIFKM